MDVWGVCGSVWGLLGWLGVGGGYQGKGAVVSSFLNSPKIFVDLKNKGYTISFQGYYIN